MRESASAFHNVEWPPDGARLAGPVVWLRGWVVGKPGHDFIDVRVRHAGGTHRGVLGLPRVDLAQHFRAARPWLPAEFILGVPVADGPCALTVEAMDANHAWHALATLNLTVAADGAPAPRVEGRVEPRPDGSWTVRDAHHPFHGHLDQPGAAPVLAHGRARVFGWLLDESRPLAAVLATTDTLVFNHLAHSLTDDALAVRVTHPGARHARLRGEVDVPSTLPTPVSLRVYAVAPDGAVTLAFAQRLEPAPVSVTPPAPPPALSLPPAPPLPALPSGRPRRLLFVLRSLWPNDATLRALDLVRALVGSHRWAARIVATEDGPLRHDFELAGAESLIVDPQPLLAAPDPAALDRALGHLQRAILWKHLDAVCVFDAVCGWALLLARRQGIATVFDCSDTVPLAPDPTGIAAVQELQRTGWRSATAVIFAAQASASAQAATLNGLPAEILGPWHTPGAERVVPSTEPRTALAPLRTVDWLRRYHPDVAARWRFRQGPAGNVDHERLAQADDAFAGVGLDRPAQWTTTGLTLALGPAFARGPLRPVLDAAVAGIPVVAPRGPVTEEIFRDTRVPLVDESNPLAFAHALLAWEALPASFHREAAAIAPLLQNRHAPAPLLARWESLLASAVARNNSSR